MRINTHRAEIRVLSDVTCHRLLAGRGRHDQKQGVSGLLSDGAVPMNEWHEQGKDQQVCGALLSRRRPEQHLQNYGLLGHGNTNLLETLVVTFKAKSEFLRTKKKKTFSDREQAAVPG